MSVPLRIGMIGAGFNARFHVQSLISVREAELGGVMSRTRASAESLADYARELNIGDANVHEDPESLAADPNGTQPALTFHDGLEVAELMAACYMSAERGETVDLRTADLSGFEPAVSLGTWRP